jgi:hypothetical protein
MAAGLLMIILFYLRSASPAGGRVSKPSIDGPNSLEFLLPFGVFSLWFPIFQVETNSAGLRRGIRERVEARALGLALLRSVSNIF